MHTSTQAAGWIGALLQLHSEVRSFPYSLNSVSSLSSSFPGPPNPASLFDFLFSPTHPLLYWPAWPRCLSPIDLDGRDRSPGKASKLLLKVDRQAASLRVRSLYPRHPPPRTTTSRLLYRQQQPQQEKKNDKIFMGKTTQLSRQFLESLNAAAS